MDIGSIASTALSALNLLRPSSGSSVAHDTEEAATDLALPSAPPGNEALRDVLARYDVRNISPREFSSLLSELHEAGGISDAELNQLAQIRLDLDLARLEPDEPLDLLARYEEKLAEHNEELQKTLERGDADQQEMASAQARMQRSELLVTWLRRFSATHDSRGIDTAA